MMKKYLIFSLFLFNCFNFVFLYSKKICTISIPKCGSHLLIKCISLLDKDNFQWAEPSDLNVGKLLKQNNIVFACHLPYTQAFENKLKKNAFKIFFIYRDPRDQIVSYAYWIKKICTKKINYASMRGLTVSQIIDKLINNVVDFYEKYLPWRNKKSICVVKFENLIGIEGGGKFIQQKKEIKKICKYLEIQPSDELINYCSKNLFGDTATFRKGEIGSWKKQFNLQQKNKFKKIGGQLLIRLGYEKNLNW